VRKIDQTTFTMTAILLRLIFLANAVSMLLAEEAGGGKDKKPDYSSMPGFGETPCMLFSCSKGQVAVPKSRPSYTSMGCGAMGGGMMMTAGANGVEKYSPCCDLFHACYQTCGSPKKLCDDAFKTCSAKICGSDKECVSSADLKGMMMNFGGCDKYDKAQSQNCDCALKDKVEEKRAAALEYFYRKHAPNGKADPLALAKKADTTAKMASLLRKLVVKYPKAIKIKKDPQQEMMDRMMKESREKPKKEEVQVEEEGESDFDDSDEKIEL